MCCWNAHLYQPCGGYQRTSSYLTTTEKSIPTWCTVWQGFWGRYSASVSNACWNLYFPRKQSQALSFTQEEKVSRKLLSLCRYFFRVNYKLFKLIKKMNYWSQANSCLFTVWHWSRVGLNFVYRSRFVLGVTRLWNLGTALPITTPWNVDVVWVSAISNCGVNPPHFESHPPV